MEVYELGDKIYEVSGEYIPVHGHRLMQDDEARELIKQQLQHGKGKKIK